MTLYGSETWDVGGGLVGYSWPADTPRANLLLQHGYSEYAGRYVTEYGALIPRLRAVGLSVFAFDMRGHGSSPGTRGVVDVEQMVQRHLAARAMLETSGRPLILLGHSLGGLVTAASVVASQTGVDGVILSSPAFDRRNPATRAVADRIARISPEWIVAAQQPAAGLSRDDAAVRRFNEDPLIYRGQIPAVMAASALRMASRVYQEAPSWQVPTLVLHGAADRFTPSAASTAVFGRLKARDKTLELVTGGRHELLNDIVSNQVMRTLLTWIDRRLHPARAIP